MGTSYDVRMYKLDVYTGTRTVTYWVRWKVDGTLFKEPFKQSGLADSFRSGLKTAASKGEAFDTGTGRPVSMSRAKSGTTWYQFACSYVDMKWPRAAATSRRGIAEAMMTVTCTMLKPGRGEPDGKVLRSALFNWAFNAGQRDAAPPDVESVLSWVQRNSHDVSELAGNPAVLRAALDAIASKLDGKPSAATVVNRKRAVLYNALEYAVELKAIDKNPIPNLKWRAPKADHEVDPKAAANPVQARTLLRAVAEVDPSGPRLKACYACSYYAGLRPEEAIDLRETAVELPSLVMNTDTGEWEEPGTWGTFHLSDAAPHAGSRWTDSGEVRDARGLKHRARKTARPVPIHPELVAILRRHLKTFGTGKEGRLFYGARKGPVPVRIYGEVWRKARAAVLTPEVHRTPLARTPYDLRHAYISTLLQAGVPAAQVALWAGNSTEVIYRVYAKVIHGKQAASLALISEALR